MFGESLPHVPWAERFVYGYGGGNYSSSQRSSELVCFHAETLTSNRNAQENTALGGGRIEHPRSFLRGLKERIRQAQLRATFSVNRELVLLYWQIGRDILQRQQQQGWGAKIIDQLAADLHKSFPDMKGFSRTNLLYMRAFAEAWPDQAIVQQLVGQIPWGHNVRILDQVKNAAEREWYLRATLQHGWSRAVLLHQIESGLFRRQGKAITNCQATLPPPQSDLAQQHPQRPL